MSPRYAAALLLVVLIAAQVLARGEYARRHATTGRGTRLVFFGACAIVVLALAWPIPAPPLLPLWAQWLGVDAMLAGVGLLEIARRVPTSHARDIADVLIWSGAAAASSSVPVFGSVAVALMAAYAVQISTERSLSH